MRGEVRPPPRVSCDDQAPTGHHLDAYCPTCWFFWRDHPSPKRAPDGWPTVAELHANWNQTMARASGYTPTHVVCGRCHDRGWYTDPSTGETNIPCPCQPARLPERRDIDD